MSILRDAMIGAHQGRAERHEQRARHHRNAEQRWRDKVQPDPYICRGGLTFDTPEAAREWAYDYVERVVAKGGRVVEAPSVYRCYSGHLHTAVAVEYPRTTP